LPARRAALGERDEAESIGADWLAVGRKIAEGRLCENECDLLRMCGGGGGGCSCGDNTRSMPLSPSGAASPPALSGASSLPGRGSWPVVLSFDAVRAAAPLGLAAVPTTGDVAEAGAVSLAGLAGGGATSLAGEPAGARDQRARKASAPTWARRHDRQSRGGLGGAARLPCLDTGHLRAALPLPSGHAGGCQ
jgi:hypothetical protein